MAEVLTAKGQFAVVHEGEYQGQNLYTVYDAVTGDKVAAILCGTMERAVELAHKSLERTGRS